ncbi:S-adenosyl-L-methionine-dependent methyltransferase [Podospora fimiseda]|uniref:S-adenosyl-L-methionine-dependent methyltransferase n=1 Tax=Podospora fimiseda TaxID=252190 RepID=A0AAN7GSB0_9PEZI|nr:S-adenosyl-L-methionine-dependent methyltransferase [Podospora fimiseda]
MSSSSSSNPLAAWDGIASDWNNQITAKGNKYFHRLQVPILTQFLVSHLFASPRCLDLATGNGLVARWLIDHGASSVVAVDGSKEMIRIAQSLNPADPSYEGKITFSKVDVTNAQEMETLTKDGKFDVVVCNMAIMDIERLDVLADSLKSLLAPSGIFVVTVLHPVFFTSIHTREVTVRYNPVTGEEETMFSKTISGYLSVPPTKGIAVSEQKVKQTYFHRPMNELFGEFFKVGMVMDGMEEAAFTKEDYNEKRVQSNCNYTQLPAILGFRMRFP